MEGRTLDIHGTDCSIANFFSYSKKEIEFQCRFKFSKNAMLFLNRPGVRTGLGDRSGVCLPESFTSTTGSWISAFLFTYSISLLFSSVELVDCLQKRNVNIVKNKF